jgi:hypothetical protein
MREKIDSNIPGRTFILTESQYRILEYLEKEGNSEVTYDRFLSELKYLLRGLLSEPVTFRPGIFWHSHGFSRKKLIDYLLKTEMLETDEKLSEDNPERLQMEISYRVPRKYFVLKARRMYQKFFEAPDKSIHIHESHVIKLNENREVRENNFNETAENICIFKNLFSQMQIIDTVFESVDDFQILDKKNIMDDETLLDKYGLKSLVIQNKYGLLELSFLASKIIGSGNGSKLLKDLCDYADMVKKPITLQPVPYTDGELERGYENQPELKKISKRRLIDYYKRFGFVERNKNDGYVTTNSLIRYPNSNIQEKKLEPYTNKDGNYWVFNC